MPKGYVVDQQYAENYTLKKGATVNIWVSKGPKTVLVPDVTSCTRLDVAKTIIETAGLVYEEESEFSNTVEIGTILRQEPLVNEEVIEGSIVKVFVSAGPSGEGLIKVPDVLGKTEQEAREMIDEAKLVADVQYSSDTSRENGIVLSQTPEADSFSSELSQVQIVINKLLSSEETPTPSTTATPKPDDNETNNDKNNSSVTEGKKAIKLDLSTRGERDTFVVKVVVEGQTIGRKVEYEASHKRSDGIISVLVSDVKGAMLKVYIDDVVVSEMVL